MNALSSLCCPSLSTFPSIVPQPLVVLCFSLSGVPSLLPTNSLSPVTLSSHYKSLPCVPLLSVYFPGVYVFHFLGSCLPHFLSSVHVSLCTTLFVYVSRVFCVSLHLPPRSPLCFNCTSISVSGSLSLGRWNPN